ncbi:MAG: hypothetical protein K0R10_438 [Alphaproteobacteria bacterium]|nr:hypothetical protein [Alphaproteobacteria bacterium]
MKDTYRLKIKDAQFKDIYADLDITTNQAGKKEATAALFMSPSDLSDPEEAAIVFGMQVSVTPEMKSQIERALAPLGVSPDSISVRGDQPVSGEYRPLLKAPAIKKPSAPKPRL